MNKKMLVLLVVVLAPSMALAGKVELCIYIHDQIVARKRVTEIVDEISKMSDDQINRTGVTNLNYLVSKTQMESSKPGSTPFTIMGACDSEVYAQTTAKADDLIGDVRNRRGSNANRRSDALENSVGGSSGGAVSGSASGMAVGSGVSLMTLTPETQNLRGATEAFAHRPENRHEERDITLTKCNVLEDTVSCAVSPVPVNILDIMKVPLSFNLPKDVEHCACIENKAKNEVSNKDERKKKVDEKLNQLNKMIVDDFSKKFINDYATHLEDMRYFSVTASGVFGRDKSTQVKQAEELICSDPADFKSAVEASCKGKLTDAQLNEKMSKLFALLGEQASGYEYFSKLNNRIMFNSDDDGTKLTREEFDKARKGFTDNDMDFKFTDNMVASLMRNDDTRKLILSKNPVPMEGILQFVTEQIRKDDKFLLKFLNKDYLGEKVFNEMTTQFKDTSIALGVLRDKLEWSKKIHPGFESLMKNPDLFNQTGEKMRRSTKSAIDVLDTDDTVLKPDLVKRCAELKSNFAQFICTDDKDIVKKVPKNELREVVRNSGIKEDLIFHDLAICQQGSIFMEKNAFSELHITQNSRESDILERLSKVPKKDQNNLFTKMMLEGKQGDEATRKFIARAAQDGYSKSTGLANDSFGSKFSVNDAEKISFAIKEDPSTAKVTDVAPNYKDDKSSSQNSTQKAEMIDNTPQLANGFATNYGAATMAAPENPNAKSAANEKSDLRNDLREFLSNKENQENVDRLMKDADDKQLAELTRLREESERRREQILQLTTENEKLKLKQMQDELSALEEKRAKAVASNVGPSSEVDDEPRSSGRGSRDIASFTGETAGAATSGAAGVRGVATSGSNSAAAESGAGGSKSGGLSGLRNDLVAGMTGSEVSSASIEPVIISSGKSRSGSLEIKSTELSNEILNFLESEPDVQTLIKMRNSGMIYKYKVVENGKEVTKQIAIDYKTLNEVVKKLIDQKIADSGRAGSEAQRLSAEIRNLRRAYTYNSLKVILGEQLKKHQ